MSLTPAVCARIVRCARRADLAALCLVSRALQHAAEARLYELIVSGSVAVVLRACESIVAQPRLGPHVRSFCFVPDARRVPDDVWATLQRALARMRALEYLVLHDPHLAASWVLADAAFQLREARLLVAWDAHLVRFLARQDRLTSLHTVDGAPTRPLPPRSLPALRTFDGPLPAAAHVLRAGASLTHLQVVLDRDAAAGILAFVPQLAPLAASLRALSVLHLPEGLSIDVFRSITNACPQLRHIGTIPLPSPRNAHRFHRALMAMGPHLRVLEVDVTGWAPPATGVVQRAIAAEIRIYAPSIDHVCFWAGATRTLWGVDGNDWTCHADSGQLDALWKAK